MIHPHPRALPPPTRHRQGGRPRKLIHVLRDYRLLKGACAPRSPQERQREHRWCGTTKGSGNAQGERLARRAETDECWARQRNRGTCIVDSR